MAQWHLRRSPHVCPRWTVNCAMRSSNMNELFRTSSLMAWVWVYWWQEFGVPLVEETQVFNLSCPCLWSLRPSAQPVAHREEKTLVSFIPLHCTPPYLVHAFRLRSFQFFVLPLPQRHSWLQPFYFSERFIFLTLKSLANFLNSWTLATCAAPMGDDPGSIGVCACGYFALYIRSPETCTPGLTLHHQWTQTDTSQGQLHAAGGGRSLNSPYLSDLSVHRITGKNRFPQT